MTTSETSLRETSLFAQSLRTLVEAFKHPGEGDRETETEPSLSLDETLDLLGAARRRAVVDELAKTDQGTISVGELAEVVACVEYDCTPSDLTPEQRNRVYIALYQSHLPRLDAADIVTYDSQTKIVTQGPQFKQLWRAQTALRDAMS
jgi:hypothetical protein